MTEQTKTDHVTAIYNNTRLEGTAEEINWILSLISHAEMKSIRRSASIKDEKVGHS